MQIEDGVLFSDNGKCKCKKPMRFNVVVERVSYPRPLPGSGMCEFRDEISGSVFKGYMPCIALHMSAVVHVTLIQNPPRNGAKYLICCAMQIKRHPLDAKLLRFAFMLGGGYDTLRAAGYASQMAPHLLDQSSEVYQSNVQKLQKYYPAIHTYLEESMHFGGTSKLTLLGMYAKPNQIKRIQKLSPESAKNYAALLQSSEGIFEALAKPMSQCARAIGELSLENLNRLPIDFPRALKDMVIFYRNHLKAYIKAGGHTMISRALVSKMLESLKMDASVLELLVSRGILVSSAAHFQQLGDGQLTYWKSVIHRTAMIELLRQQFQTDMPEMDPVDDCDALSDLDPDQKRCISLSRSKPLVFITGKPGTGKSRVIRGIIETNNPEIKYVVLTPTCMAARRLATLGISAHTIDMVYGWSLDGTNHFVEKHNGLILDEGSQVTEKHEWMIATIAARMELVQVIRVGDAKQIKPFQYGFPFFHMMEKYGEFTVRLETNHRLDPASLELEDVFSAILASDLEFFKSRVSHSVEDMFQKSQSFGILVADAGDWGRQLAEIRKYLQEEISPDDLQILAHTHQVCDFVTQSQKGDSDDLKPDDLVVFRKNAYVDKLPPGYISEPVVNGEIARIHAIVKYTKISHPKTRGEKGKSKRKNRSRNQDPVMVLVEKRYPLLNIVSQCKTLPRKEIENLPPIYLAGGRGAKVLGKSVTQDAHWGIITRIGSLIDIQLAGAENVKRGDAVTGDSYQGNECGCVIVCLDGPMAVSKYFTNSHLYAMASRGKRKVIFLCTSVNSIESILRSPMNTASRFCHIPGLPDPN